MTEQEVLESFMPLQDKMRVTSMAALPSDVPESRPGLKGGPGKGKHQTKAAGRARSQNARQG